MVTTSSLSTRPLRIDKFLYCDEETDAKLLFELGLDICRPALSEMGSGSQLIKAATIRLSIKETKILVLKETQEKQKTSLTFKRGLFQCKILRMIGSAFRGSSVLLPTAAHPVQPYALFQHTHSKAFLKPTSLTCLAPSFIYFTVVCRWTGVLDVS